MNVICIVSVATNAGITVFTMTVFDDISLGGRFWIFILFQWIALGLQVGLQVAIPDVTESILHQMERQKFIVSKLIDQVQDDLDVPSATEKTKTWTLNEHPTRAAARPAI